MCVRDQPSPEYKARQHMTMNAMKDASESTEAVRGLVGA